MIFDNDPPLEMFEIVNAELRSKGHQLLTGYDAVYVDLIHKALDDMLKSVENRDVQKLTKKDEIKKMQQFVHEKTERNYDRMERLYKNKMNMPIIHRYIIAKVERVKQLLIEGFGPKEILIRLNYCNISYLSEQFRTVTGIKLRDFIKEQKK